MQRLTRRSDDKYVSDSAFLTKSAEEQRREVRELLAAVLSKHRGQFAAVKTNHLVWLAGYRGGPHLRSAMVYHLKRIRVVKLDGRVWRLAGYRAARPKSRFQFYYVAEAAGDGQGQEA